MNKLTILTSIAGLACAMSVSAAFDTGTIQIRDSIGSGSGGSFRVQVLSGLTALTSSDFRTFCVEKNENIQAPSSPDWAGPYNVKLNPAGAVNGGEAGPNPDPISWGTAWLFSQFAKGTLASTMNALYGANAWADDSAGNTALQNAIWYLEQESSTSSTLRNNLLTAAASAYSTAVGVATTYSELITKNSGGVFGVIVMNLSGGPGANSAGRNQDLLAIVPEPSTYIAGGLALLPLLFGLRARFQRK